VAGGPSIEADRVRIEVNRLCVDRGHRRVIAEVSLTIGPGQSLAIVGPNGAGKTTLMQAMLGLLPAAEGWVAVEGKRLTALTRRQIARRIAYVPQSYEGFLGFRVRDVVASGRYAHLSRLEPAGRQDQQVIDWAIATCGLAGLEDRALHTLSGGERQKVWLAAALAQESPALFLDEPTSALDPKHQAELIRLLQELVAQQRTLVVICHDLNVAAALGERVVALVGGRAVFDGPVAAFLQHDRLRAVFEADFVLHDAGPGRCPFVSLKV